jgi:hypothetical protein
MIENLAKICDEFGQLVAVKYALFEGVSHQISAILLQFESTTATIRAVPDDDTIEVILGTFVPLQHEILVDMSGSSLWELLKGKSVFWAWQLINQQGYTDGLRLEFGEPNLNTILEMIVIASTIKIFRVSPVSARKR